MSEQRRQHRQTLHSMQEALFHFCTGKRKYSSAPVRGIQVRGQGMVEFALALPVFLVLVFGVIESGHLLMTYSAVYSAAREGARYGAAVGASANGMEYAKDCDGMKAAAVRVGFLGGVKTDSVSIIMYDKTGVLKKDSTGATVGDKWCTQSNAGWTTELSDRIQVEVAVNYAPIVPLVPIPALTVNGSTGGVRSASSRTLVQNVVLEGVVIPTAAPRLFRLTIAKDLHGGTGNGGTVTPGLGDSSYLNGIVVNLSAAPDPCWNFTGWTIGGATIASANTSVSMTQDVVATANFVPASYLLTVDTATYPNNPGVLGGEVSIDGVVTTVNGHYSGTLTCGQHVLTPLPNTHYATTYYFYNWSGAVNNASNPLSLNLNADMSVTASFTTPNQPHTLVVNLNIPNSGTITNDVPLLQVFPGSYNYLPAVSAVNLTAAANPGFGFVNWTNGANQQIGNAFDPALAVPLDGDKTVNANFGASLTLNTVECGPSQGCTAALVTPATAQAFYSPGTTMSVKATAGSGWQFVNWTNGAGSVVSTSAEYGFSFPSTGTVTLNAHFSQIPYTLGITVNPVDSATTSVSAPGPYYYNGSVTIMPSPVVGYGFSSWELNGAPTPADNNGNKTLTINPITGNMAVVLNMVGICAPSNKLTVSLPAYMPDNVSVNWNLSNTSGYPVHISSLTATWNGSKVISQIALNGRTLYSGAGTSGTTLPLSGNNILPPSSNINSLTLTFTGNENNVSLSVGYDSNDICH